jgi:hypothetical protein
MIIDKGPVKFGEINLYCKKVQALANPFHMTSLYSKCQKFCPNYPENPLFEKSRFSGPFRQKRLSYSEITLMLFRTLPVAPGCNKVPEKEKTSGNHSNWNR